MKNLVYSLVTLAFSLNATANVGRPSEIEIERIPCDRDRIPVTRVSPKAVGLAASSLADVGVHLVDAASEIQLRKVGIVVEGGHFASEELVSQDGLRVSIESTVRVSSNAAVLQSLSVLFATVSGQVVSVKRCVFRD